MALCQQPRVDFLTRHRVGCPTLSVIRSIKNSVDSCRQWIGWLSRQFEELPNDFGLYHFDDFGQDSPLPAYLPGQIDHVPGVQPVDRVYRIQAINYRLKEATVILDSFITD